MRVLHTSDWHLGHTLKEVSREDEHAQFLAWLLATCEHERPDVLLVTGDVFDTATPTAAAERMWFELLATARARCPHMAIIAIAGNHDSPLRLTAAAPILDAVGVHVVGALPRTATGAIDMDRVIIEVADGRALVAAVPFLRPGDLPAGGDAAGDPLEAVYAEVLAAARARRRPEQALIAMGHLYVTGAEPSQLSERRIAIGGAESASLRMFADDLTYVALGHMHRAQRVGRDTIRYAGSPLPLALDEARYRHQVVIIDVEPPSGVAIRTVPVPRAIEIARIPSHGAAPLDDVLTAIAALPAHVAGAEHVRPYLEVVVALTRPEPKLRAIIDAALDGKHARLVRLGIEQTGTGAALADAAIPRRLAELDPRDVFEQLWHRDHAEPPSDAVRGAFERLLEAVRGDAADPAERS